MAVLGGTGGEETEYRREKETGEIREKEEITNWDRVVALARADLGGVYWHRRPCVRWWS